MYEALEPRRTRRGSTDHGTAGPMFVVGKGWLGYDDTKSILKGDFAPMGVSPARERRSRAAE